MSQIIDTIKGAPGNIAKLPTTIYNIMTGSYYGVPVATFGLIGITSIALAYVTLTQDDEKNTSDTGVNDGNKEDDTSDDDEYPESNNMEQPRQEPPSQESQMTGGKKKQKSIKKRGKKNKKTIKKGKK
jgi:hypothetical protein